MINRNTRIESYAFYILLFAGIALRFWHFTPQIEDPHLWRQCDTAHYIYDFYEEGIDLLHPKACWMGSHQELILEFPLPEALAALLYQAFGADLIWARLVFLLFYLGSLFYLFKVIQKLADRRTARLAAILYLFMPIGIFYSRAIHIDFSALFFAHAMLWYWLQGIDKKDNWRVLAGSLAASLAFMIKAPYAFYLALPLFAWILHRRCFWWVVKRSPLFLLPLGLFLLWQSHVDATNAAAPEWSFFPTYKKTTTETMWYWYFGVWEQRINPGIWWLLFNRLAFEITGLASIGVLILGIFWKKKSYADVFFRWWGLGVLLFLFIFINLNEKHNYYQIPLLPVAAFFLARTLIRWGDHLALHTYSWLKWGLPWLWAVVFLAENVHYSEKHYYQEKPELYQMGAAIGEAIPKDDFLVCTYGGFDRRCPLLLYHAHRYGWQLPERDLNPSLVNRFVEEGADWFVLIRKSAPDEKFEQALRYQDRRVIPLPDRDLTLFVYRLQKNPL